jgi:Spy/CpxP family protein refolding chaperone
MTETTPTPDGRTPLRRRVLLGAAFAAVFVAGGLIFGGVSLAAEQAAAGGMAAMHHGMHGHAMMRDHLERMLTEVGASPEQKAKIEARMREAMQSMGPVHERLRATHGELHRLLLAPTIDRAAIEKLRADRMADFDQVSRNLVQALVDAAEVLTPEQRAKLGQIMAQRHGEHMGGMDHMDPM